MNYELTPSEVLISLSMSELQQLLEEMRKGHGRKPSAVYRKLVDAWLELSLLQDKVLKEAL